MSQDEKPSDSSPKASVKGPEELDSEPEKTTPQSLVGDGKGNTKFKVIADIHSGMVLVAPVVTPMEDDELEEEEVDSSKPPGLLNQSSSQLPEDFRALMPFLLPEADFLRGSSFVAFSTLASSSARAR